MTDPSKYRASTLFKGAGLLNSASRRGGICLVWWVFFQAEDGIRDIGVTGVQTCALPIFGLVALALFLASVLYLGWDGGIVGGGVVDGFQAGIGAAVYGAPLALLALGTLMLFRSSDRKSVV